MALIVGRKEIARALGGVTWRTVQRWKKRYKLPVHSLPSERPYIFRVELLKWLVGFEEIRKKDREK